MHAAQRGNKATEGRRSVQMTFRGERDHQKHSDEKTEEAALGKTGEPLKKTQANNLTLQEKWSRKNQVGC